MGSYVANPETVAKRIHFRQRRKAPCFWCHRLLRPSDAEMDHLVSIRRYGSRDDPNNMVISCYTCNVDRSVVQELASAAIYLEDKSWVNVGHFSGGWYEWHQRRDAHLELMLKLERLYHEKLSGQLLDECLAEIDEVLKI